jgi:hypothetical protein
MIEIVLEDIRDGAYIERYRQLCRGISGISDYNIAHAVVSRCFKESWAICQNHAHWAAYCIAGAAITAVTDKVFVPPAYISDEFDLRLEKNMWRELDRAMLQEPNVFHPDFRQFLLRHFVPAPSDYKFKSAFASSWASGLYATRCDSGECVASFVPGTKEHGEEKYRMLSAEMQKYINVISVYSQGFVRIYAEKRLPRLQQAIETDAFVRSHPSY